MTMAQTIQQHVANFPPDKQAEVLDFVLFLQQKLRTAKITPTEESVEYLARNVGGSLKEYAPTYVPLHEAREQAGREYFHELTARR